MSDTAEQRFRHLTRLFNFQGGKCAICQQPARLDGKNDPMSAVRFRIGSSYGAPGRVRPRVMVHRKCAQERSDQITMSQPIEELRRRAGRWGDTYEIATVAQQVEQPTCSGMVGGSIPSGGTNSHRR